VLRKPTDGKQLRNLAGRLNELDQQKFHAKMKKKLRWIEECKEGSIAKCDSFISIIVLDRPAIEMGEFSDTFVVDFNFLEKFIQDMPNIDSSIKGYHHY